jgi:hypothetical protein
MPGLGEASWETELEAARVWLAHSLRSYVRECPRLNR